MGTVIESLIESGHEAIQMNDMEGQVEEKKKLKAKNKRQPTKTKKQKHKGKKMVREEIWRTGPRWLTCD